MACGLGADGNVFGALQDRQPWQRPYWERVPLVPAATAEAAARADLAPRLMLSPAAGDMEQFPPMAGQGCGIIGDVSPAAEVVRRVAAEARAVLDRLAALR